MNPEALAPEPFSVVGQEKDDRVLVASDALKLHQKPSELGIDRSSHGTIAPDRVGLVVEPVLIGGSPRVGFVYLLQLCRSKFKSHREVGLPSVLAQPSIPPSTTRAAVG